MGGGAAAHYPSGGMNSYQIEYLEVWKVAFHQFLGWTENQIVAWAKPLLDAMDPLGMVINEPPLFYVARELAASQSYYDDLSQRARFDLIRDVQHILSPNHERSFPQGFDFAAAKANLQRLLHANDSH